MPPLFPWLPPTSLTALPPAPPPHQTILDGEMVVDEHMEEERWDRRFLAYDMVMCNGHSLVDRPWMVGGLGRAGGEARSR